MTSIEFDASLQHRAETLVNALLPVLVEVNVKFIQRDRKMQSQWPHSALSRITLCAV